MASAPSKRNMFKEIVQALMTFEGRESVTIVDDSTGNTKARTYLKYRCPRPDCPKPIVKVFESTGYKNPHYHLLVCYGRGLPQSEKEKHLKGEYVKARDEQRRSGGSILSHFFRKFPI